MTRPIFIFGIGGHARDLAEIAAAVGYRPVLMARDEAELNAYAGLDEAILEAEALSRESELFACGIGENRKRAAVVGRHRSLAFPSLLHPGAILGRGIREAADSARGVVVFPGVCCTSNVRLGQFCTINTGATLSHDVEIGDFANVSPGAHVAGNVAVDEGAWIGVGAAINQGSDQRKLRIGAWTTIGSGAVVLSDCEPNAVYVGVPARRIK